MKTRRQINLQVWSILKTTATLPPKTHEVRGNLALQRRGFSERRSDCGMTLIELAAVSAVIGLLAVTGFPSFITLHNNQKLKSAADRLQSALLDAKHQSRRLSRKCTLSFVTNASTGISEIKSTQPGCLAGSETQFPPGVVLTTDMTNLTFSFRGIPDRTGAISLSLPKLASETRCVEIVAELGLIKQGIMKNASCNLIH